jgi:hypothetical protein
MPHPSHTADERVIVFVSGRALEFFRAMAQPFQLGVWNDAQITLYWLQTPHHYDQFLSNGRERAIVYTPWPEETDGAAVTHWSVECDR